MYGFKLRIYCYVYLTMQSNYSEKAALQTLKASDWHLEGAFDVFYSQPQVKSFTDSRHLEELFNRYKGKLYLKHLLLLPFLLSSLVFFWELWNSFFFFSNEIWCYFQIKPWSFSCINFRPMISKFLLTKNNGNSHVYLGPIWGLKNPSCQSQVV